MINIIPIISTSISIFIVIINIITMITLTLTIISITIIIDSHSKINVSHDQVEFWLVTSFHEHGSLCDFLKNNVLSVQVGSYIRIRFLKKTHPSKSATQQDLIKICLTMAKGLAHLHGGFLHLHFYLNSNMSQVSLERARARA